ncbi:Spliceosome-associated coiled-coil protein [Phaffia rhodozyma]|uniref:Spliceosome-associated coiled-coil protein n=1 Tax=Phaffia rhodozyma TaxID=264483 RepID=A0A0F7SY09_PHARH|nr:Spliceosome-associated coiled-coil protein [Phaffia rhodozyma]
MAFSNTPTYGDLIDSLPYIDRDLEDIPGLREKAESLIQVELKESGGLTGKVDHPRMPKELDQDLFSNSPALTALLQDYPTKPLSAIDTSRYQLPMPSSDEATEEEWKAASDNARAQLEHLNIRQINLSLLSQHGSNAHLIHNHLLESEAKRLEAAVESLKAHVVDINRKRKNAQTDASQPINRLNSQWNQLISSTLQTELANTALEAEVEELRKKERALGLS